jgi:formylglycine-generating enzyme required for sulfatase activity
MMGCNDAIDTECWDDQYPYHELLISSFAIDQTEVTANAYAECVDAGDCQPPEADCNTTTGEQPVTCVDWFRARDYCAWRGARLPTEAEWEKAARGTDGRLFPWGNEPITCARANLLASNCGESGPIDVGSKPAGASPYGALDMAGNVFEWVSDWYDAAYYVTSPDQDPQGPPNGTVRAMRSASWNYGVGSAAFRGPDFETPPPDYGSVLIGFRCAVSP